MVDTTTLIVLASLVQTAVLTFTLVIFMFQFRSQEKALKESAYQNVVGRYNNYMQLLVDKPELNRLLDRVGASDDDTGGGAAPLSQEDRTTVAFILGVYGILEEIYLLYTKKWIDKNTWDQWATFLKTITQHPLFPRVHGGSQGTFDKDFQKLVDDLMAQKD